MNIQIILHRDLTEQHTYRSTPVFASPDHKEIDWKYAQCWDEASENDDYYIVEIVV